MRSLSFASTFFISFVAFIFLEKNGLITFFWQPFFKSHFKMFVVEKLVFDFCFNNNMFAKRKKKYVYSRHDSCYLAFKKWERNMDNLSNALFLLEASDSFISFANFFCANPTLYPKVCSFDVWTRENGGIATSHTANLSNKNTFSKNLRIIGWKKRKTRFEPLPFRYATSSALLKNVVPCLIV